jgi:hypothetical protein
MTDQGYTAEIRMPWSVFERLFGGPLVPEDGQIIGFDITVMDIDGTPPTYSEGAGGAMAWSSDFENDNSPGVLGNLIIRDAPGVGGMQLPGDCDQDGSRTIADVMCMVKLAYPGFLLLDRSPQAPPCATDEGTTAVLDLSGDSRVNGSDILLLADFLFGSGSPPGECFGVDEAFGCAQNSGCP